MTSILEGRLARTIGRAAAGLFLDATLERDTAAAGDEPWAPGAVTTETFACKAIHEEWSASLLAGGLVDAGDQRILVLASTLATEPRPLDRITIRGETFTVVPAGAGQPPVATDPAKATWTLRARR